MLKTREDVKRFIYELKIYDLSMELLHKKIVQHISLSKWNTVEQILSNMQERGYWCRLSSPFEPEEQWYAGFTPHGCTGWNGIPDNQMSGDSSSIAIMRAALLTVMMQEIEGE